MDNMNMDMNTDNYVEPKKKGKGLIIFVLILIIIILCLTLYILGDKGVINVPFITKEETTTESKDKVKEEKAKVVDLDVEDANVVELFNNAHYGAGIGPDEKIFNNSKLTLVDMDENYKLGLAANLFKLYEITDPNTGVVSVSLDAVKNAYEKIFGPNTFTNMTTINLGCPIYKYNSKTKEYETTDGCGGTTGMMVQEKIISAKKYSDKIEITSAAVYYGEVHTLYRDFNKKTTLKTLTESEALNEVGNTVYDRVIIPYIEKNKDDLEQYTYTFELNEDGFYYYTGVERTQE